MITSRRVIKTVSAAFLIGAASACDSGAPSRSADDIADDSALAADLALANRDTLLVDSIGKLPPVMESVDSLPPADTTKATVRSIDGTTPSTASPGSLEGASRGRPATIPEPVRPSPAPAPAPAPAPGAAPRPAAPRLAGMRACGSPALENQSECIRASIATSDARLNRIYRALITEMRRQEGVKGGAKDPPSVQRLRIAQRAWLVYRDTECRRRGRGKEGALWARPRARCLAQFSVQRANELADNFSRLTAR